MESTTRDTLLSELRIDRQRDASSGRKWLPKVAIASVGIIAVAAWWTIATPQAIPVRTALAVAAQGPAAAAPGSSALDATGYVVARRQATVSAKITGRVVEVLIEEGQKVAEGDVIARLDASNARAVLAQAEAQVAQASADLDATMTALDDARPIFSRNEKQYQAGVISAHDFDLAKAEFNAVATALEVKKAALRVARSAVGAAERNLEDTVVRAPFNGIVTVKAAQVGEIVSPISAGGGFTRTGIGTLVDMDSLEVEVDVSENFINRVRPGQPASIRLSAYPDADIAAEVIAVIPTADRAKATVKVRVGFKDSDPRVLPEMGARVSFLSARAPEEAASVRPGAEGVLVPTDAVIADGSVGIVYVIKDGIAERRSVRLGARASEVQTIVDGLSAGTRVARSDIERLSDQARVSVDD